MQQIQNIKNSLQFLDKLIRRQLNHYAPNPQSNLDEEPELDIILEYAPLNHFLQLYQLNTEEYVIVLLALVPHILPTFLESIIQSFFPNGSDFPEIGGLKTPTVRSMLPTGETAVFILAGKKIEDRIRVSEYFSEDHFFAQHGILHLEAVREGEPKLAGRLLLNPEYVELFTTGKKLKPSFGPDFPAKLIDTQLEWADLVINKKTNNQIHDMKIWLDHNQTLLESWGMSKKLRPGYRALFYGPPGTGKTLTAALLGKEFKKDVYRIDLSQVVSKYIGETEKNLEKVFLRAQHRDWILFFDEADALFGKRSNVQNAHDKYANQEVSYLLQRVEDFGGLIILASNYKANIDPAFIRRFNAIIHFPLPNQQERFDLWNQSKPETASFAHDVDIWMMAGRYDLSGSSIVNVIQYASLMAIHHHSNQLSKESILEGIRREYEKEERVFTS